MKPTAFIKALDTKVLLALYNELTGKNTRKFASRNRGEHQVLNAIKASETTSLGSACIKLNIVLPLIQAFVEEIHRAKQLEQRRIFAIVVADSIKHSRHNMLSICYSPQRLVRIFVEDQFERAQGLALDAVVFFGNVTPENRGKFTTLLRPSKCGIEIDS